MALAIAYDDVKTNRIRGEADGKNTTGGFNQVKFCGSRDNPDLPHANLNQRDAGRASRAHFHIRDQFHIIIDGKGRFGRHNVWPYCVHFSRAYTPYGPIVSDADTPLTQFVLRAHHDPGTQRLPEKLEQLKSVANRQPWQITRPITFPTLPSGMAATDSILQPVPDIKDEDGLAVYTLNVMPNAKTCTPDPGQGEGQFLLVFKGSLLHNDKELNTRSLVFVYPNEGPFPVHAGPAGLEALILNFPNTRTRQARAAKDVHPRTGLKTWQCTLCAFVYDEAAGMPEEGIAPGTRWQDVPETWNCPDCNATKADFQMIELKN